MKLSNWAKKLAQTQFEQILFWSEPSLGSIQTDTEKIDLAKKRHITLKKQILVYFYQTKRYLSKFSILISIYELWFWTSL